MNAISNPQTWLDSIAAVCLGRHKTWGFTEARNELATVYKAAMDAPQVVEHRDGSSVTVMNTQAVQLISDLKSTPSQFEMMLMLGSDKEMPRPGTHGRAAPIPKIKLG
jgi:hypothetical protein